MNDQRNEIITAMALALALASCVAEGDPAALDDEGSGDATDAADTDQEEEETEGSEGEPLLEDSYGYAASTDAAGAPGAPVLALAFSPVDRFDFSWGAVPDASYYRLEESATPGDPFVQLGGDVLGTSSSRLVPLHLRWQARYRLQACNASGCTASAPVDVVGTLAEAVGYFKASNTGASDRFGYSVALSSNGRTLAVGAPSEDSSAAGIDGNQADDAALGAGAVYVFTRTTAGAWSQQAYIKASNPDEMDQFGRGLSLSANGNTLAVSAIGESSNAAGVGGNQADDSLPGSGAVYVFTRSAGVWTQQAYVKASNPDAFDDFGASVALSGDGNTLAVGADLEDSNATGIGGNQGNGYGDQIWELFGSAPRGRDSGAVYVLTRDDAGVWSQQAYIKPSNTLMYNRFGVSVDLSTNGNTLAVGAQGDCSNATGIDGNQTSCTALSAGAAFVFTRSSGAWSQQAYVKASNSGPNDWFGGAVALSGSGSTLAVGARHEDGASTGVDGNQADESLSNAGAVYVLTRSAGVWSQQAYVKASNAGFDDRFGATLALSIDGNVLAVGGYEGYCEDGSAVGLGGNQASEGALGSGAAYVFTRSAGAWSQRAYVKASNTGAGDQLAGAGMALSSDGTALAVGAAGEDGAATGIGGDQASNLASQSGAVYVY